MILLQKTSNTHQCTVYIMYTKASISVCSSFSFKLTQTIFIFNICTIYHMILSSYIVICYACVPFCFALIQLLLFVVHLCLCSCAFVLRLLPFCCIYSTFSRTFISFHQHLSPSPPPSISLLFFF